MCVCVCIYIYYYYYDEYIQMVWAMYSNVCILERLNTSNLETGTHGISTFSLESEAYGLPLCR
jgi:hypothetical protein